MNHAPSVAPGTTWQGTLTEVATVLAANSPLKVQIADLLIKEWPNLQVFLVAGKMLVKDSLYHEIQLRLTHGKLWHGYNHHLSLLKPVSDMGLSTPPPSINSSSPTMTTKRKNSAAPKPVTLTLTGKLKPNILTEAPPPVSSKSTIGQKIIWNSQIPTSPWALQANGTAINW